MAAEATADGYFSEAIEVPQIDQEPRKKCGATSDTAPQAPVSASGCFDCNICLDFAVDPVVTLCGHLYCWPCIYKWLQVEGAAPQQCPVCKASLSQNALVPLYGRGHSTKRSQPSMDIPNRPSSSVHNRDQTAVEPRSQTSNEDEQYPDLHPIPVHRHRHQHYHVHSHEHLHPYPYYGYPSGDYMPTVQSTPPLGSTRVIHSTAGGVLGGMAIAVLPWVSRNHQEATSMYYSNPYYAAAAAANGASPRPRLRRQEMEVERSLHQIWVFLFCCAVLCLLLF